MRLLGAGVRSLAAGFALGMLLALISSRGAPRRPARTPPAGVAQLPAKADFRTHRAPAGSIGRRGRHAERRRRGGAHDMMEPGCGAPPAVEPLPEHDPRFYESLDHLAPLPREALDLSAPGVPAAVARTRGWRNEIILFTADSHMSGWAFHFVTQLRSRRLENWVILSDGPNSCESMHLQWDQMVKAHGEQPLSCVHSSYPASHPGWEQWAPYARKGSPGKKDGRHQVYIFWATRWVAALALLREGLNVLSLDIDAVILGDVYARLRSPPLIWQDVLITQNEDAGQSLNCGFVYFNRDAPGRLAAAAASGDRKALRLQGAGESTHNVTACTAKGEPHGEVPAAEWVCEMMWERLKLFLEIDLFALQRKPRREVLWEQDAWNDVVKSLEFRRRIFPWATGYGKTSELWLSLGYKRVVTDPTRHPEKFVQWNRLMDARSPPFDPSSIDTIANGTGPSRMLCAFFGEHLYKPLLWIPLCSPPNISSGAQVEVPAGETSGVPLGVVLPRRPKRGLLMIAPIWLASLGAEEQADWSAAQPAPLTFVHITNMWKCFPHVCWSKAGRLFWLRAHGFWDTRLDSLGLTPQGAPFDSQTRALALPQATAEVALARLPSQTRSLAGWPRIPACEYGFRRFHALVHNLVTLAILIGRKPVLPRVPCEFIRAVTPSNDWRAPLSRFGIHHPGIVVTGGEGGAEPQCHMSPGTWRWEGPGQCYHDSMISDVDYAAFVAGLHGARNGSVAIDLHPRIRNWTANVMNEQVRWQSPREKLELGPIRAFCRAAKARPERLLVVEGLLSQLDEIDQVLVDAPLPPGEFATEALRRKSSLPRWPSLLLGESLEELKVDCPGAGGLIQKRMQCVGYFLAE